MSNAATRLKNAVDPRKTRARQQHDADTPVADAPLLDGNEHQVVEPVQPPRLAEPIVGMTAPALVADRSVWKLTVPVTDDGQAVQREFKKMCLDRGVTPAQFARDAINAHLKKLGITHIILR